MRSILTIFLLCALSGPRVPYILVASAYGGDNLRTFADLYMGEVAGLVLVDADPNDVEPKAMRVGELRGITGFVSRLRDCRNLRDIRMSHGSHCPYRDFPRG
jgi:hypothetical protein